MELLIPLHSYKKENGAFIIFFAFPFLTLFHYVSCKVLYFKKKNKNLNSFYRQINVLQLEIYNYLYIVELIIKFRTATNNKVHLINVKVNFILQ